MYYGVWDSWGIQVTYCHPLRTFTLGFIKWWVAFEWESR